MNRYDQFSETLTDANGTTYSSGLAFLDFLYDGPVEYHQVQKNEVGRLDLISYIWFNGDHTMAYVIGWFNSIRDPFTEVAEGCILAIPTGVVTNIIPFTYANLD
jgi:hypothetical protein